ALCCRMTRRIGGIGGETVAGRYWLQEHGNRRQVRHTGQAGCPEGDALQTERIGMMRRRAFVTRPVMMRAIGMRTVMKCIANMRIEVMRLGKVRNRNRRSIGGT